MTSALLVVALVVIIAGFAGLFVYLSRQLKARPAAGPTGPGVLGADGVEATAAAQRELVRASEVREQADRLAREVRDRAEQYAAATRLRAEEEALGRIAQAEVAAQEAARAAAAAARADAEADLRALRTDLDGREERLVQRDVRLTEREERVDAEHSRVQARDRALAEHEAELARKVAALRDVEEERRLVLERTAGLTAVEAKHELVAAMETQAKRDATVIIREIETAAKNEGEERARKIVTLAIQRVASAQTAESVVSVLHLPGDEMKGRIIGREGRNIRTFEQVTGVNVIIDDTPEAVLLSCFDPVRREVGRLTLEALVLDGRIHPQRIEEQYEKSKIEVEALCVRSGEDAVMELGITDMHEELIALLGRLRYRTSYGQNVLGHLIEAAHLAGVMAAELRLPKEFVKRGTLLHDLGKALTHEVEGSHALIGAEIARKYGEHEEVVHAIEAHHNEVEPRSIEAVLTQAADAISGGRPGARRESLESYVQRLERIEEIATSKEGVDKVFAMQAGREVRVMVLPDRIDDIAAQVLARDIAKQIEEELTYPGQIRVTVVRETRTTEVAK